MLTDYLASAKALGPTQRLGLAALIQFRHPCSAQVHPPAPPKKQPMHSLLSGMPCFFWVALGGDWLGGPPALASHRYGIFCDTNTGSTLVPALLWAVQDWTLSLLLNIMGLLQSKIILFSNSSTYWRLPAFNVLWIKYWVSRCTGHSAENSLLCLCKLMEQ